MSTLNITNNLLSLVNMGLHINGKGKVETDSQFESPQDCLTELGMTGPEAEEQLVPVKNPHAPGN